MTDEPIDWPNVNYDPESFESQAGFQEWWKGLTGRSKFMMRRFRPGRPLKVKENWEKAKFLSPHPIVVWIYGVTETKPPQVLCLPIHPGFMSGLRKDGILTDEQYNDFLNTYGIPIPPDFLEEVAP